MMRSTVSGAGSGSHHMLQSEAPYDETGDPLGDRERRQVCVRTRDRRHDRGIGDVEVLEAEDAATRVDDRAERARADRVEVAARLVAHERLDVGGRAGARLGIREPANGGGGAEPANELDSVEQHTEVARVGEEPVLDRRWIEGIRRAELAGAPGIEA